MPFLITVSGNRIPLRRGHSYVVGRGLDCDVVLEDTACSRRHAQISLGRTTATAFLEDLGSRNGTYLNGEPVRSRVTLRDGSRIQVGASILLTRLSDEQEEIDLSETGTIGFESSPFAAQEVEGGELSAYGVIDLVKLLFNGRRSVTVHVELPDAHAVLEVREGEVHHADYAGLEGFNGLVKLGRQSNGIFWFVRNDAACNRTIQEPTVRLMAELVRCLSPAVASRTP